MCNLLKLQGTENDDDHRVIAKKFYNKRNHDEKLKQVKELAHLAAFEARQFDGVNPVSSLAEMPMLVGIDQ